jgi:hypothetical protein
MTEEGLIFSDDFLQQECKLLVENMLAFAGVERPTPSKFMRWESNFGGDKLSISIDLSLISYLWDFSSRTPEYSPIFDLETLKKWKAVTIFACGKYVQISDTNGIPTELVPSSLIDKVHLSSFAALAGFPLLENIARKISKKWDNHGKVTETLSKELYKLNKNYETGSKISSFKDKMQIMLHHLPKETQQEWDNFDNLTRRPDIAGIPHDPIPSVFERLHKRRNSWAHGQEFEGEDSILISLIIKFIYLNCARFRIQ